MTKFSRWVRNRLEHFLERYYEGPDPPARIGEAVIIFANLNPLATRAQWTQFAAEQARESYKAGWLRGIEYVERDPDWHPTLPPEIVADMMDPHWRDPERGISLEGNLSYVVPDEFEDENKVLQQQMERMTREDTVERGRF